MTRFLHQFSYSKKSMMGLVGNPTSRRGAVEKVLAAAGGKILEIYYCYGEFDGMAVSEFPNQMDTTAVNQAIDNTGAFSKLHTTTLIEIEEVSDMSYQRIQVA